MTNVSQKPASLKDVMALKLTGHRVEHLKFFPTMTSWFKPILLSKLLLSVIISETFGQYADRRLVHAALDKQPLDAGRAETNVITELTNSSGDVWIDFVADLGDGFDATYSIAYLLAQPELKVNGCEETLPRGRALVMGGDEVYPTASPESYGSQLTRPYSLAWPNTFQKPHPPVFAIPGNHDWYDGLAVFLAIFCKTNHLGNWESRQRRSYFSAQLTEAWWIWGIDIALIRNMDQPQADYFVDAAEHMPEGADIFCVVQSQVGMSPKLKARRSRRSTTLH
jgi:Calcineurin-like phosphoesterase